MDNPGISAYPEEEEVLLEEGARINFLAIEEDVLINNNHACFKTFNGIKLTIFHLAIWLNN